MSSNGTADRPIETPVEQMFRFETFELDAARRRLTCSGRPVAVGDRALDILTALVRRAGEVVSKEDLILCAWPDTFVLDVNLRVNVSALRRVFGASGQDERLIVNVVGRGYMFAGKVETRLTTPEYSTRNISDLTQPTETPVSAPSNLPQPPNSLIGRDREMTELTRLLSSARLVTLIGSGGIGKTRLAIEFGLNASTEFPDGIWLVDLATSSSQAVAVAVAVALGVRLEDEAKADEALLTEIGAKRQLLILDNCEYHVAAIAAFAETLLSGAPALAVLVTSQEALCIDHERVMRLNSLALPPLKSVEISGFGAVALLAERAHQADERFAVTARNAGDVAEICRRLDGIPLALEIAASWISVLGATGVRGELDRLLMFTGRRTAKLRYRTMRDMVEWSHNLLNPADQTVFRRLAVFPGTFSLDAALAMSGPEMERWTIIDAIGRLIDKSLVTVEGLDPPRYRLLEIFRLFATEKLEASVEMAVIFERHARFFLEFHQITAKSDTGSVAFEERIAPYVAELDNTRAAIRWAFAERERAPVAVRLVAAASRLFIWVSLATESRRLTERALELFDDDTPIGIKAQLVKEAGRSWMNEDPRRALPLLQRAADLYHELQEPISFAITSTAVGNMQYALGHYDAAKSTFEKAREILADTGQRTQVLFILYGLGLVAVATSDFAVARQHFAHALDQAHSLNDESLEQYVLIQVAELDFIAGNVDKAIERMYLIVERLRSLKPRLMLHLGLLNLGTFLISQGRLPEALDCAVEALEEVHDGDNYIRQLCLQQWALLGALAGRLPEAARLIGFVDAGVPNVHQNERTAINYVYRRLSHLLEEGLDKTERLTYNAEGTAWSEEQAVAYAKTKLILHLGKNSFSSTPLSKKLQTGPYAS